MPALKFLLISLLTLILMGCSSPTADLPLEAKIREYLYRYQPTTGPEFVEWANQNLTDYSPRQIYIALHDEANFQAKLGHPNVVGVLSFATRAWAEQHKFPYDSARWVKLQQEAVRNMREDAGEVQFWPEE
jgi:hypothetical protein